MNKKLTKMLDEVQRIFEDVAGDFESHDVAEFLDAVEEMIQEERNNLVDDGEGDDEE